jgi:hypothetical protein
MNNNKSIMDASKKNYKPIWWKFKADRFILNFVPKEQFIYTNRDSLTSVEK